MAVVETKVKASTAAAAVSGLALFALGRYVFKGSGVPDVVTSWVYVIVPGVLAFGAGWLAKHTSVTVPVAALPASVSVPSSADVTVPPIVVATPVTPVTVGQTPPSAMTVGQTPPAAGA